MLPCLPPCALLCPPPGIIGCVCGSVLRIILEFKLPKDGSLVAFGQYALQYGKAVAGLPTFMEVTPQGNESLIWNPEKDTCQQGKPWRVQRARACMHSRLGLKHAGLSEASTHLKLVHQYGMSGSAALPAHTRGIICKLLTEGGVCWSPIITPRLADITTSVSALFPACVLPACFLRWGTIYSMQSPCVTSQAWTA